MSEPFIAEIRLFPYTFAPRSWAFCNGQLLPIAQNTALFSLLGTSYGGDGRTTFALPDLQGRIAMHAGAGPGLSPRDLGEAGGSATVSLTAQEIPAHTHAGQASADNATTSTPGGGVLARVIGRGALLYNAGPNPPVTMNALAVAQAGSGQPHSNLMPYLGMHFCIALSGIFPPRN